MRTWIVFVACSLLWWWWRRHNQQSERSQKEVNQQPDQQPVQQEPHLQQKQNARQPQKQQQVQSSSPSKLVLVDTHCHAGSLKSWKADAELSGISSRLFVMATHELDWFTTLQVCERYGHTPAIGVHPWFAHNLSLGWRERLREVLEANTSALVGEIGLDKAARTKETGKCEYAAQVEVFRQQLEIAHELHRPVSIHCVRSIGKVFEVLMSMGLKLPPAIALHSFGAGPQEVTRFLQLPCTVFFGFSFCINAQAKSDTQLQRVISSLKAIPADRLLLESDEDDVAVIDASMGSICGFVAKTLGWTPEYTARLTTRNAHIFQRSCSISG